MIFIMLCVHVLKSFLPGIPGAGVQGILNPMCEEALSVAERAENAGDLNPNGVKNHNITCGEMFE
jgi:hypothetical protein